MLLVLYFRPNFIISEKFDVEKCSYNKFFVLHSCIKIFDFTIVLYFGVQNYCDTELAI